MFDSNRPRYFAEAERALFADFLDQRSATYFVLVDGTRLVACGGHFVEPDGAAGLAWGMVAQDVHGRGIGTRLVNERLKRILALPGLTRVTLNTSQYTVAFYERFGFKAGDRVADGFGPGIDRIDMVLEVPQLQSFGESK